MAEAQKKQQASNVGKKEMQDPKERYQKDFPGGQEQEHPGVEAEMTPRPDFGEKSYRGNNKLKDMIALITGGDSGIGRAICLAYAREGADIALTYMGEEKRDAEETKRIVEAEGRRCLIIQCDLSKEQDCSRIVEETVKSYGRIDILVNNAAYQGKAIKDIKELDPDRVLHTFKVNIVSMFNIVRAAQDYMKPGSAIINTGSINAYQPSDHILDYAVTKGAIVSFTQGLAQMLMDKGIRVNCVAPGPVWTPLIVQSFEDKQIRKFGQNEEKYPIGRAAQPAELAPAYVFLAAGCDSSFISGETLTVTGGAYTA